MIGSSTPPAATPFNLRRRWLASTSALRIPITSAALALGVALSGEAHAQAAVNPVQTTTYNIQAASNPITFGRATNIDTSATHNVDPVVGGTGSPWNVTVQGGGQITGYRRGIYLGSQSSVTNAGTITGTNFGGVVLGAGGSVSNQAGGRIVSNGFGIGIYHGSGNVTNAGTITGGVGLFSGGSVKNQAGATIYGILVAAGSGTVTNAGAISRTNNHGAVALDDGGSVVNQTGGTISGRYGVYIMNGGTVTNAGTIAGTGGTSVHFAGPGSNTLILQTGSVLNGDAVGSTVGGASNALVLQGTGSANNTFRNFSTLDVQASGLWALNGVSTIGTTTVDSGTLVVGDASHPGAALTSPVTVNAGGALAGQGTLIGDVTVLSGGAIAPGAASPFTTLNVTGNASFASGSFYQVNINGSTGQSDKLAVSGTATLTGGSVQATYSGTLTKGSFDILHAGGGLGGTTFAGVSSNFPDLGFSLSYSPTDVFLNLTSAQLGASNGLNRNQQNAAGAINNFFNAGGALPAGFASLFSLTGTSLGNALSQLSGEAPTGAQQSAFQLMGGFLGLISDPLINGGGGIGGGGALPFAPERSSLPPDLALAYAKAMKAPPGQPVFDQRWNVWGSAFGGGNGTDGNPVTGSHDLSAAAAGVAAGADYRVTPNTRLGFALAGGSTSWTLSQGLGSGLGDAFMAGIYGKTYLGPVYLTGSLAAADHWISTDRTVVGDHLTAQFAAQSYGGRIEGGYRLATAFGGVSPYAAAQLQSFRTPAYAESDLTGGGFGLAYASRNATDTRSELGGRFDREIIPWSSDKV
ncbi:autotransporter outer membrane beta-barrel domain-containing protein, partial [Bradyrhizobium sp.]|uniref:autotransporter outer membrane beta-barrel domain-containing protein n=1 Tax=Bradyrhizobium sp. TaxID=376 RepID=UPI003C286605